MLAVTRTVETFPSVRLPSHSRGVPVEVALIAQLGIGAGDQIIQGVSARQRAHASFVDAMDEPSARIGGMNLEQGDATSLYTFSVGSTGHPFHRHAGHRVFTAISGSSGAQLRFSTASSEQVSEDPQEFIRALRHVTIPPDCLFTVRFGGGTWHQFLPLRSHSNHPALFALSCHTNELGGDLPEDVRTLVAANTADIPSLTEVLPPDLQELLAAADPTRIPTVALSLHAPPVSLAGKLCAHTRRLIGPMRSVLGKWRGSGGFRADNSEERKVIELDAPPSKSLLRTQLAESFNHQDCFALTLDPTENRFATADTLLAAILDGFLENRPAGVSRMMSLRNVLVKPLRLRTSPLGCPVSSLLSPCSQQSFAGRFPVLAQETLATGTRAQVILGADDRHLKFRSCVGVEMLPSGAAVITLGTRVQSTNLFGHFYMAVIDYVHRNYVSPIMLQLAVDHAVRHGQRSEPACLDLRAFPLPV
jgi:hypothetical protein